MYKITDQTGRHLDSGSTRKQVLAAVQRLLSDTEITLPRMPQVGKQIVLALPIGKYVGVSELRIAVV